LESKSPPSLLDDEDDEESLLSLLDDDDEEDEDDDDDEEEVESEDNSPSDVRCFCFSFKGSVVSLFLGAAPFPGLARFSSMHLTQRAGSPMAARFRCLTEKGPFWAQTTHLNSVLWIGNDVMS
jgi:hypothetical protein